MEINIDTNFDVDEIMDSIVDEIEESFREYVEKEVEKGHIECECGSNEFDIETWLRNDDLAGAAVCRGCEERIEIDFDTSDLDKLR